MSTKAETRDGDVEFATETEINEEMPSKFARYSTHVTTENKTERATVKLSEFNRQVIRDLVVMNEEWRSDSQLIVDAIVFYLDSDRSGSNPKEIVNSTDWRHGAQMSVAITPTLFDEIEQMVNHPHTPWNNKQEFYTCALREYDTAGFPAVSQR